MKVIIDLDDTLSKTENRDYEHSQPIQSVIDKLGEMRETFNDVEVVLHTARGMNSCKGYVRWSDIKLDAENLLRARLEKAMNLGTREKYSKYYTMSAADYMKWCWNNPQAAHSPYKMFEGAMLPADERDSEGNIVYKYNGAKF